MFKLIIPLASLILVGASCAKAPVGSTGVPGGSTDQEPVGVDVGEGKTREADGFVRYPGEPSRGDASYYIVEDLCGQFTKEFMEGLLGVPLVKAEPSKYPGLHNCSYYLTDTSYVMLNLEYLDIANQRTAHEFMDRTVRTDTAIPMKHMVVYQENGLINEVYFDLWPGKFLSMVRSSGKAISEEQVMDLAVKLGAKIQNFK